MKLLKISFKRKHLEAADTESKHGYTKDGQDLCWYEIIRSAISSVFWRWKPENLKNQRKLEVNLYKIVSYCF